MPNELTIVASKDQKSMKGFDGLRNKLVDHGLQL
jgi:hypothetical protein